MLRLNLFAFLVERSAELFVAGVLLSLFRLLKETAEETSVVGLSIRVLLILFLRNIFLGSSTLEVRTTLLCWCSRTSHTKHSLGFSLLDLTSFHLTLKILHWLLHLHSILVLLQLTIDILISLGVLLLNYSLVIIGCSISHVSIPILGVCLCVPRIAMTSHVTHLLRCVLSHHSVVSSLLHLLTLVADCLLLSNDSNTFAAIKSLKSNLDLERQLFDLGEIEVFHLDKFRNLFHCVLKGDLGIIGNVSYLFGQECMILGKLLWIFISKSQTFVQFNFRHDIRSDNWLGKDIGEVVGQFHWVDPFNLSSSHLGKF